MKPNRILKMIFIMSLLMLAPNIQAQETVDGPEPPPKYRMELVWIADQPDGEGKYIFMVGEVGYRTVEGLKSFVAGLSAGSRLEWDPGCLRRGDEPLLCCAEDMAEFKKFCEEHGVEFILIPSG